MAVIHLRGVPDATHERLKARASADGLSLNRWLVGELDRLARAVTPADWAASARAGADRELLEALDPAQVVRSAREARSAGSTP